MIFFRRCPLILLLLLATEGAASGVSRQLKSPKSTKAPKGKVGKKNKKEKCEQVGPPPEVGSEYSVEFQGQLPLGNTCVSVPLKYEEMYVASDPLANGDGSFRYCWLEGLGVPYLVAVLSLCEPFVDVSALIYWPCGDFRCTPELAVPTTPLSLLVKGTPTECLGIGDIENSAFDNSNGLINDADDTFLFQFDWMVTVLDANSCLTGTFVDPSP